MSDKDTIPEQPTEEPVDKPADPPAPPAEPTPQDAASRTVNRGALIIVVLILLSFAWYLFADRFTPYTRQARLQGFVVGVAPEVAGVVSEVQVRNDEMVAAGQPLFLIDSTSYEIALKRAESDYESAQRQVGAGGASVEAARAQLRAAIANREKAQKDAERLERLYKEDPGAISVRRLEVAQASYASAKAGVDAAEADIQRAIEQMGGDEEDNTILKTALTALEKARLDLDKTVVRAPSRGVVTDLRADVGRFAGTGSPVVTLIAIQDVWINAEFTENNLGHLEQGSPVEIIFDALPGSVFTGEVRSIGLGVSAGQAPAPGTLPTIQNNRDWLRQAQRFPVAIGFDVSQDERLRGQIRVGGQASVIAYTGEHPLLDTLGRWYIRLLSWLSYVY
ncbi:MAG: HlyD family efflux transporter periplasmic adaptor subunit [Gammaproteobacteria bacterium]|nr:HlyD family efflux transporter periplasmic adaptor subunit [Gammaproteobacteria bacterium]